MMGTNRVTHVRYSDLRIQGKVPQKWYPEDMPKRTSIYLTDDLAGRIAASDLTIAQLLDRGLGCTGRHDQAAEVSGILHRLDQLEHWHAEVIATEDNRRRQSTRHWLAKLHDATTADTVTAAEAGQLTGISPSRARDWLTSCEQHGLARRIAPAPRKGQGKGTNPARWEVR